MCLRKRGIMKGRRSVTKGVGFFLCAMVIASVRDGTARWIGEGDFDGYSVSVGNAFIGIVATISSGSEVEKAHGMMAEPIAPSPDLASSTSLAPSAAKIGLDMERMTSSNQRFLSAAHHDVGSGWLEIRIADYEIENYRNRTVTAAWQRSRTPRSGSNAAGPIGHANQQTGPPLENATGPMKSFRSAPRQPINLIKANWLADSVIREVQACDIDQQCSQAVKRGSGEKRTIQTASLNSCAFAFDGECDEPELCYPGTDSEDCRGGRRARPRPTVPLAYMCVTVYGTCQLFQPIPIGAYCVCMTAYGAVNGIAQ